MDIIIARLRREPALVWGIIGTVAALIVSLATAGTLTTAAIPLIVAAIARQFLTPADSGDIFTMDDLNDAFDAGQESQTTPWITR